MITNLTETSLYMVNGYLPSGRFSEYYTAVLSNILFTDPSLVVMRETVWGFRKITTIGRTEMFVKPRNEGKGDRMVNYR